MVVKLKRYTHLYCNVLYYIVPLIMSIIGHSKLYKVHHNNEMGMIHITIRRGLVFGI